MAFTKCLVVLFALAVWVNALTMPHIARAHHHRAIAARIAVEDTQPLEFQRRQITKRCKPRPSNSTLTLPPPPPKVQPTPTPSPAPAPKEQPSPSPSPSPPPPAPKVQPSPSPSPAPKVQPEPAPPKPSPSTTHAAPAPSPSPVNTASSNTGNSGGGGPSFMYGTQTGQGTFYSTGLGACGITNHDSDYICAVSHLLFDAFPGYDGVNPNTNPVCNRKIRATYQGKSVTVTATDRCEGCALADLDFSPSAFDQLADPSVGRLSGMTWTWA